MIVPMSKLSVLIYHREKMNFLRSLQEMGIIHIVDKQEVEPSESASETYKTASGLSRSCERVAGILTRIKKEKHLKDPQRKAKDLPEGEIQPILNQFEKAERKQESLIQKLADIQKDIRQLQPWGEFDPELIETLAHQGITPRFFETSPKRFKSLKLDDIFFEVIHGDKNKVGFLVLEKGQRFETDWADEVMLPMKSLQHLNNQMKQTQAQLDEIEKTFAGLTVYIELLTAYRTKSHNIATFAAADTQLATEVEGKAYSLRGWFPSARERIVRDFLDNHVCYYQIDPPEPDDNVPILLKNNRFTRLFEPITKIYSLPSYREIDPTPYFAPFFVVYFGLCLGDLGYGALTLLIALLAFFKGPAQFRNFCRVGMVLGVMTIISGMALNSFFGESIFYLKGNKEYFFRSEVGALLSFLGSYINPDRLTVFPAMGFAIFLGIIQVLLGIVLQCANRIRQQGLIWGIHPASFIIIICGILFTISDGDKSSGFKGITGIDISTYQLAGLHIGSWLNIPPQGFGVFLVISGLVFLFVFNNPDKNIFLRPLIGLWELYGFATGIVGDILSYLRLFALGLASGLLGHAFNGIAFGFIENGLFPGIIGTILLMALAHALNFGLAILGSFVHPLRLTFVEFYKNLDFEGGGKSYAPFLRETV